MFILYVMCTGSREKRCREADAAAAAGHWRSIKALEYNARNIRKIR